MFLTQLFLKVEKVEKITAMDQRRYNLRERKPANAIVKQPVKKLQRQVCFEFAMWGRDRIAASDILCGKGNKTFAVSFLGRVASFEMYYNSFELRFRSERIKLPASELMVPYDAMNESLVCRMVKVKNASPSSRQFGWQLYYC